MDQNVNHVLRSANMHWNNGQVDVCRQVLEKIDHGAHCSESIILLARVFLQLSQAETAVAWLEENVLRHDDEEALAVHWLLLGQAYTLTSDFVAADRALDKVQTFDVPAAVVGEAAYVAAFSLYQRAEYSASRKRLLIAEAFAEDLVLARVAALSGWLDHVDGKLCKSYHAFLEALTRLRGCRTKDLQLHASVTNSLAIAIAETSVGDPSNVDAELKHLLWTASTTGVLVDTLRHLGLAYQRRGDALRGIDKFVASADIAAGSSWAVSGYAECANAALAQGEVLGAFAFADHACRIVERIERAAGWGAIRGEQRLGLLTLALVLARLEQGASANRYQQLYYYDSERVAMTFHDVRRPILERHVAGVIAGALGDQDFATATLKEVELQWAKIDCDARASEAVTDSYRGRSGHLLRATRLEAPSATRTVALSRRDQQILDLVLTGKSYAEIANCCGLAVKTVRAITSRIFAKFQVRSRAELLTKLRNWE